jgi:hypothetical protein
MKNHIFFRNIHGQTLKKLIYRILLDCTAAQFQKKLKTIPNWPNCCLSIRRIWGSKGNIYLVSDANPNFSYSKLVLVSPNFFFDAHYFIASSGNDCSNKLCHYSILNYCGVNVAVVRFNSAYSFRVRAANSELQNATSKLQQII